MNVVADTHTWVWWITQSGELSSAAGDALAAADQVLVPAVSLWEVAMLIEKGRIPLLTSIRDFFDVALVPGRIELAPLTPHVAARSSELGAAMHGDPADRLIAATALELSLPLVTRDGERGWHRRPGAAAADRSVSAGGPPGLPAHRRMRTVAGLQTVW